MILALLLAIPNAILSLMGRKLFRQAGFDITPFAIMAVAASGNNILFGAIILTFSKALNSFAGIRNLWMTIPLTLVTGYLALFIENGIILLGIYHVLSALMVLAVGRLHARYPFFMMINIAINLFLIRVFNPF